MAYVYKRKGSPYYQAAIIVGGKEIRFSTKSRSRAVAKSTAEELEEQENQKLEDISGPRLVDMADRFLADGELYDTLAPGTVEVYKTKLRNLYRVLGDPRLSDIDDAMVRRYIRDRKNARPAGERDTGIINDLRFLSTVLSYAAVQEDYLKPNWFRTWKVKDYGLVPARNKEGFLTEKQVANLYRACAYGHQRLFVTISVECGTRTQETLSLRWSEIDFTTRVITLQGARRTKNGRVRMIPMTERVVKLLKTAQRNQRPPSDFVFPGKGTKSHMKNIRVGWSKMIERAGLKGVTRHDLRHTYASWAIQRGLEDSAVQNILGHSTPSMTKRYAKHSLASLQRSVRQFEKPGFCTLDYTKHQIQPSEHIEAG